MLKLNTTTVRAGSLALVCAACWSANAQADSSATASADRADEPARLQEIIVTATKRKESLQNVAASIVAETGAQLEHRGATQLEDIIANTPGLTNPSTGPANQTNLVIRGVTTGASAGLTQSTVSILYDDIPIDPAASEGTTDLRVVDIARVEVLRGPQGTLFGAGSLSGAVRYVTNQPNLNDFQASIAATAAATETGGPSQNGTLMMNAPIVQGALGLRAVGYYFDDGGWIADQITGQRDINDTQTGGGRVMLAFRPSDRFRGDLTVMYQDSKDYAEGDSLYAQPGGYGDKEVSDGINEPLYEAKNAITSLSLQYDYDWASLDSITSYQDRRNGWYGQDYFYVPLVTGIVSGFQNPVQGADQNVNLIDEENFTQEFRLTSRDNGPLKWIAGTFFLNSAAHATQQNYSDLVAPYIGGSDIVNLQIPGTQREVAGFGHLTYTLADHWDLGVGVRVSRETLDDNVTTGGFLPVGSVSASAFIAKRYHEADTPTTPNFSLDYRANADLTLYGEIARGFRVGGINTTSGTGGRPTPQTYGPDSLWNYELGAKGRALDGRVAYSTDIYYMNWTNIQVSLQNTLGNYTGNAGNAALYGFEGQVDSRLLPWLQAGASLSLSHNRITQGVDNLSTAIGVINVEPGDRLPDSPESQASLYAETDFDAFSRPAYLRLSGDYTGVEYTGFAETGTKFGDFTTANLRAGMTFDRVELTAFLDNAFNTAGRRGALDPAQAGPVFINHQDVFYIRPRTVGLTARVEF